MSGKCEDLNPGTGISNDVVNEGDRISLSEAIGGPLAQCRPTGHFTTFIHRDDPIHDGEIGRIDGMNVKFPNIPGYVDGRGNNIQGGELAEGFDGFINLDFESDNFGDIDGNYGFKNTKLSRSVFNLVGAGSFASLGVYQNRESEKAYFDAILNHPNTANSIKMQLLSLKKWGDFHKISHEDIEKKFRANGHEWLADNYKTIVDNNFEFDELIEGGMVNHLTADGKNFNQSGAAVGIASEKSDIDNAEKFFNNEIDGIKNADANLTTTVLGIGDVSAVTDVFKEAPSQFATAFGLEKNKAVVFKYPHDAVYGEPGSVAGQDHIMIEQFEYRPPQAVLLDPRASQTTLSYLSGLRRNSNIKQFIGLVKMPIPNNLSFTNGVSWGDSKLNSVQAAAFFTAFGGIAETVGTGDLGGGISKFGGDISNILGEIRDGALASGQPANLALSSFLAQFALGRAGINVDGNAALTRGTGAAINPNLELLFNGPKLRNFSFQFQFAPNDELDATIMRKIQKFFKKGMSPVRNQDNLIFLGSPNVFRLRYRTQENTRIKGLPMHKICALTQCEINYAPDGVYQSYEDSNAGSSPVRTVMTLSFTELTPIFQDDYLADSEEVMTAAPFVDKSTFNDLYDNEANQMGMEKITPEDTGF